jgi:hypothetical protein
LGSGILKVVVLPEGGVNSSFRSSPPVPATTTEVTRAGSLKLMKTLSGDRFTTDPLAGMVLFTVE